MPKNIFPFAVQLIGFSEEEAAAFDEAFAVVRRKKYAYFRLVEDNLQDPDLYIACANQLQTLAVLAGLHLGEVRPALLAGTPAVELGYPRVDYPIRWPQMFTVLDELIEKRAHALARLEASGIVAVPERRRRSRLDIDLTDPAEYEKMRTKMPDDGVVLIVDRNPAFRDYLSDLLARQGVTVEWAGDEMTAVELCRRRPVSVVMINTTTPKVDPYRLCWGIKDKDAPFKTAVIFLISKPFEYDAEQARYVGAEGFLHKPLASHQVIAVLKKYLPFGR